MISHNPEFHARSKHIDITPHFLWDHVEAGTLEPKHIPPRENFADIFTKGLLDVWAIAQLQFTVVLGIYDSCDDHAPVFSIPENNILSSITLQIILGNTIIHVYKLGNSMYNNNHWFYYIEHPLHILSIASVAPILSFVAPHFYIGHVVLVGPTLLTSFYILMVFVQVYYWFLLHFSIPNVFCYAFGSGLQ